MPPYQAPQDLPIYQVQQDLWQQQPNDPLLEANLKWEKQDKQGIIFLF
jgi:hypothetical protein